MIITADEKLALSAIVRRLLLDGIETTIHCSLVSEDPTNNGLHVHAVTFHNSLSLKLASNAVFEVYKFPCWLNLLLLSTGNARQHVG